jgi:hypothetical protein
MLPLSLIFPWLLPLVLRWQEGKPKLPWPEPFWAPHWASLRLDYLLSLSSSQACPQAIQSPLPSRESGSMKAGTPFIGWFLPGPCGWCFQTSCLLFPHQVVLKGDAKKLQLYGVSVLGQCAAARQVKQTVLSPALDPFQNLCSPCCHISFGQTKGTHPSR